MTYSKSQQRWAIVGGGFLGMTLALRLAQQGKSVTLYESAPSFGGLASAWQLGDVVWDRHYHITLFSDLSLRSLLRELGLEEEICWQKARTGFYVDSKLHSMSNALEFLRFPPLNLLEKVRLAATILRASRITDWKSLEKVHVSDWLEKWSGSHVLNKIWLPLLRAKLGESYRDTSAAFIWATIARLYAARRTGTKTELFGYVTGGYSRIIQHFEQILLRERVECHVGQAVRAITSTTSGRLRVERTPGNIGLFDKVVVTAAAPIAARVCAQLTPAEKKSLGDIKYQGIICPSLLLEHSLSDFYITNIADGRIPYTAVIEMSSIVDRQLFGGRALVYLPKYVSSDSIDFDKPDDQIREEFMCALERMYPRFSRNHLLCFQVSRVKHLVPIPTINYSESLPKVETSVPGLFILNSAHILNGTLNVNETIQLAESGARRFARQQPPIADYSEHELPTAHR